MRPRNPFDSEHDLNDSLEDQESHQYHSGNPPPTNDANLLQQYDIDSSDQPNVTTRAYDDPAYITPGNGLYANQSRLGAAGPRFLDSKDRSISQTSGIGSLGGYSDDRSSSDGRNLYNSKDDPHMKDRRRVQSRNRNSILSLGGGFMGKVKNRLGMAPGYSEMDMPLTDSTPTKAYHKTADEIHTKGEKQSRGTFKFKFGRRQPDPSTLGPRIIHLNNAQANAANRHCDNHVSTAKYNFATFLPRFLFQEFSKYANLFFLFTAVLQQIPNLSPTNKYTTIVPLGIVLAVSAIKEIIEDSRRKSQDKQLNTSKARVLSGSDFTEIPWHKVAVGDILRVESEEPFPADLVLLTSSEPEGLCYIETANLDGETNLKIKQAIPETASLIGQGDLARLGGRVRSEQPNSSLYTYEATLTLQSGGGEKGSPLNPEQLLLRGATLRNTQWIHGLVVFTGHETKLMRNATATPIKMTNIEHTVNKQILLLCAVLVALSITSAVGNVVVRGDVTAEDFYLIYSSGTPVKQFFSDFITYWILYSNLVPISLFVTIEIIKYWIAILISSDLDIYHDKTDTPSTCRTSSLVEELGQVEYVFSDKTGTLTCNQMEFRQCSIGGIQYANEVPEERRPIGSDEMGIHTFDEMRVNVHSHPTRDTIRHFLALLSTCHTVIPETIAEKPGKIKYQAASPDEGALVEGAVMLGYKFVSRKPRQVAIEAMGQYNEYELLAVCEFNSTRKRMSTIYKCPDGKIRCYCKGADTVILERLAPSNSIVDITVQHLEEYAAEGLRTLCLAMREVPEQEYREWSQVYQQAAMTVSGNRAEELDKAAELIEHDFTLLGATAIEDKLQDGVPETIHTLQSAGIKVWVLTGDRQETAINIGMSCRLINEDMTLLMVNEADAASTRDNLERKLGAVRSQAPAGVVIDTLALVIDGKSLTYALERDLEKVFLDLAVMCKAVICCRVSPLQKALVVKLVKRHLKAILLAIGDGANDVSMIQAAHIGIGISGMEGLQAARSADVAIAQFRFLRKLLLVHGSWAYQRVCKVILYFFYKNTTLCMTQFWYAFQNLYSGQTIYESWTLSFYNVFFTALPPFVLGIFDQYVSARLLDHYPQLYQLSQSGAFFRMHSFVSWVANGFYHSLILYFATQLIYQRDLPQYDGTNSGRWIWSTTLYTAALVTTLGKAALITNLWTKYTILAIPGSLVLWFAFLPIYSVVAPKFAVSEEYQSIIVPLFTSPVFWATIVVVPVFCLLRDFAWKYAKRMYFAQSYHHVQEIQKYNIQDYRPRMEQFQKAIRKVRQVQRMRKQRGYAFSQTDESQARVLQAYDTTRERGRYGEMASGR